MSLRFAVIAPPLKGHYRPLSRLASELIARGHEVIFVHQPEAASLVDARGARFEPVGENASSIESWTRPMARIRGLLGLGGMMKRMERFTTMLCREAPPLLKRLKIDAVIADQLEPAGGMVAERLGIPWISAATALPMNRELGVPPPYLPWAYDPSPAGIGRNKGGWRVADLLMASFNRTIARNAAELGIAPKARMEDCFSTTLQLAQLVPGLDFPRRELPACFHYTGPWQSADEEDFTLPPSDGRPNVYATLGTLQGSRTQLFRKVAEACQRLDYRLVVALGRPIDQAVRSLPGDPLVYEWVPQRAVLPQVDLVVSHAGLNTVLETVGAGCGTIVMPLAFEQPAIAARVEHSGAGIRLSKRASVKRLASAIEHVRLDPAFRENAGALRDEMRSSGGAPRAADLIEAMFGRDAPRAAATREDRACRDARDDIRSGSS